MSVDLKSAERFTGSVMQYLVLPAALLAAMPLASIATANSCKLTELASLPLRLDTAGGLTVPASIEGHEKYLLIDTAGVYNLMTHSAVEELSLSRVALNPKLRLFLGASGKSLNRVAIAHSFKLGNLIADKVPFIEMPDDAMPSENAGTLAPVVLANYDLEIDPGGGKLNLFSQQHCRGEVVYWTHSAYSAIPFRLDSYKHIITAVVLDGRKLSATLDTGSSHSWVQAESLNGLVGFGDLSQHRTTETRLSSTNLPSKELRSRTPASSSTGTRNWTSTARP